MNIQYKVSSRNFSTIEMELYSMEFLALFDNMRKPSNNRQDTSTAMYREIYENIERLVKREKERAATAKLSR